MENSKIITPLKILLLNDLFQRRVLDEELYRAASERITREGINKNEEELIIA